MHTNIFKILGKIVIESSFYDGIGDAIESKYI